MRPDVAFVSPYPLAGRRHEGRSGVASYAANLAHGLTGHGLDVRVVAPFAAGPARYDDGGVRVERCFPRGPRAVARALRAARATGAPVVHLQHELFLYGGASALPAVPLALGAAARSPVPTVVTMHQVVDPATVDGAYVRMHRVGAPAPVARAGLAAVQQLIGRLATRTVVHEAAFARHVPGAAVVPHGVEALPPVDVAAARRRLGLRPDRLTALCFGFVAPYKGLETACAAAEIADVDLVVAGGEHPRLTGRDDYAGALRRRFPSVRFTGYVDEPDVADWFGAADVALFCYPQPHAASGALALALAYGTPSLLSPRLAALTGAAPVMVAGEEAPAVAARLRAVTRPDERGRLREATRSLASRRSWSRVARDHATIYEEVRGDRRPDGRRVRAA